MPRDLDKLNLRGPVRGLMVSHRLSTGDAAPVEGWQFARDGACVRRTQTIEGRQHVTELRSGVRGTGLYEGERLIEGENGLIVKEEELPPDVSGWSMFGLHGVAFPTLGARRVRTAFLDDGPVATIFDDNGEQTGVVTYELDDQRRVLKAVLSGGAASPLADQSFARFTTETGTVVEPQAGLEHVRTEFAYDAHGHLARREVSLVGLRTGVESYEYNDQGDVIRIASHDGRPDVRIEYAYDEHGNWIRKTTHHALGVDEEIRNIQYYADETIGV